MTSTETFLIGSYAPSEPGLLEIVYQIVACSGMETTDEGNDLILKERGVYKKKSTNISIFSHRFDTCLS